MLAPLLIAAGLFAQAPSQVTGDRYFKEEHYTGADYLLLRRDGTYTIIGREHMGVFAVESGRWQTVNNRLKFLPTGSKKNSYEGTEVEHGTHKFLAFDSEEAPSILIAIEDTRRRLDSEPDSIPPYVFFEIDRATFDRETKTTYPFRFRHPMSLLESVMNVAPVHRPSNTRLHPSAAVWDQAGLNHSLWPPRVSRGR